MEGPEEQDSTSSQAPQHDRLVEFQKARLGYPSSTSTWSSTPPIFDLTIQEPTAGGHALLGRNAVGKSLLGQAIVERQDTSLLQEGTLTVPSQWMSNAVAHVSFDSHQRLLLEDDDSSSADDDGLTTFRAISGGGPLNKAAQFLIVRFGLYGLLPRSVQTLSTGEIRKTMLVRALSTRPKLLILDNAFDGLDVASRQVLQEIVQKTITGFTQDILVQGVNSKATAHTQILMMTHRPEELVDAIQTVSYWKNNNDSAAGASQRHDELAVSNNNCVLVTEDRNGRSGMELFEAAFEKAPNSMTTYDFEDEAIPSVDTIARWWNTQQDGEDAKTRTFTSKDNMTVVQAKKLTIQRGEATLLQNLNWSVKRGERWLVGGGNGAGKSTVSRLLVRPESTMLGNGQLQIHGRIGWVSTERHMEMARSTDTVQQVILSSTTRQQDQQIMDLNDVSTESTIQVASWLGIDTTMMNRPFSHLSQGQQKLVLIVAALVGKPHLLVLDEPCQGLDVIHRQQVLALVERICRATDISLVYITHHLEELLPSVSHALHLKDQQDVYQGSIQEYHPEDL